MSSARVRDFLSQNQRRSAPNSQRRTVPVQRRKKLLFLKANQSLEARQAVAAEAAAAGDHFLAKLNKLTNFKNASKRKEKHTRQKYHWLQQNKRLKKRFKELNDDLDSFTGEFLVSHNRNTSRGKKVVSPTRSPPPPLPPDIKNLSELRIDPSDGVAYSKKEFEEFYDGLEEWETAEIFHTESEVKVENETEEKSERDELYNRRQYFLQYMRDLSQWHEDARKQRRYASSAVSSQLDGLKRLHTHLNQQITLQKQKDREFTIAKHDPRTPTDLLHELESEMKNLKMESEKSKRQFGSILADASAAQHIVLEQLDNVESELTREVAQSRLRVRASLKLRASNENDDLEDRFLDVLDRLKNVEGTNVIDNNTNQFGANAIESAVDSVGGKTCEDILLRSEIILDMEEAMLLKSSQLQELRVTFETK
eukprot:g952.t1